MVNERCFRTLESFSNEELISGSCRWDFVCWCEGGCPLNGFTDREIFTELYNRGIDSIE